MPSVAELLVKEVKENEQRRILEIIRACKNVEEVIDKIQKMIING